MAQRKIVTIQHYCSYTRTQPPLPGPFKLSEHILLGKKKPLKVTRNSPILQQNSLLIVVYGWDLQKVLS